MARRRTPKTNGEPVIALDGLPMSIESLAAEFGQPIEVMRKVVNDLLEIQRDIAEDVQCLKQHSIKYINGYEVFVRWNWLWKSGAPANIAGIVESFRSIVISDLPIFEITCAGEAIRINDRIPPASSCFPALPEAQYGNPFRWWFNRRDLKFYEVLHPELHDVQEDNPFWPAQVTARHLRIPLEKLDQLALKDGFQPFRLDPRRGVTLAEASYLKKFGLNKTLFDSTEVKESESLHPDLYGFRKTKASELKQRCFAYAEARWKQDPSLKDADIDREIKKTDWVDWTREYYGKNTVRNWIRHDAA